MLRILTNILIFALLLVGFGLFALSFSYLFCGRIIFLKIIIITAYLILGGYAIEDFIIN